MLPSLPLLRDVLRSDLFPELLNHKIVKPVFAVVVALLFLGPQVRPSQACKHCTCCVQHWVEIATCLSHNQ
jgi:hypothetical protein